MRQYELLVVFGTDRADPGIEDLNRTSPGLVLGDPEFGEVFGPERRELVPDVGLAVDECLDPVLVLAMTAVDQIRAEREWRTDESHHRHLEPADQQLDLIQAVREGFTGLEWPQCADIRGAFYGPPDDRPDSGLHAHLHAGRQEGRDQVVIEDRGIDG